MRGASPNLYMARAETTIFIKQLISDWDLDDQELVSLAANLFADAIVTSLVVNPMEREEEEPFIKSNFQQALTRTVEDWRDYSEEEDLD